MQQKWHDETTESKKLRALHADLEAIAQAASHQLKDPLRQAIIDIEGLQKDYDKKTLDESAQNLMDGARTAITQVICRIEYIREFSRLVEDKGDFVQLSCDAILAQALIDTNPIILSHHAVITADPLPTLYGKEKQLITLFVNLIDNAIAYNDSDSPKIHISVVETDNVWEFSVSDNGVGVEEVYRDFVFALFQSLDPTGSTHGTGLAFCKRIIQNHNGEIWYKLKEDQGTCFYFTIPSGA